MLTKKENRKIGKGIIDNNFPKILADVDLDFLWSEFFIVNSSKQHLKDDKLLIG